MTESKPGFLDTKRVAEFWDDARKSADEDKQSGYLQDEWPTALGINRFRGEWALVPALGERRMGIGFGLFEPNPERFRPQMARVAQAFRTPDADVAYTILREERISLVFVGKPEQIDIGIT